MNSPTIHDLVTHLDPRNCGLTVQLSEQAAVEINARHRERVAEREEQLSKVTAERDEARQENEAMHKAIKDTLHSQTSLCEAIKAMLNSGYDGPLPDYARAKAMSALSGADAALTKLQPFIK